MSRELSITEAMSELAKITALLNQRRTAVKAEAEDAAANDDLAAIFGGITPEAQEFADAAHRFHRRAIASHDCRPRLRIDAEERRAQDAQAEVSPEMDAQAYADSMRTQLRK